jgi:hypothetical protein
MTPKSFGLSDGFGPWSERSDRFLPLAVASINATPLQKIAATPCVTPFLAVGKINNYII